ncbi:prepilin peptidase [Micromonospora sp. SH-82]|uniref:prepilin peptidase n=1 Tax=Micromonospora sp. SH-82 TaxID=3132938 RepID=UPI003EC08526
MPVKPRETSPTSRGVRVSAALAVVPLLRLAVVRHAVPVGSPWRAGCAGCAAPIGLDRPWPALSPVARCGRCGTRVGAPPGVVEAAVVAAVAAVILIGAPPLPTVALLWWLGWVVPATLVDLAVHRLPDRLTYPAAAGTWTLLGLAAVTGAGAAPWLRATAAGLVLALSFAATTLLLGRRGFGLGDAKLALGVGLLLGWYGWSALVVGMLLAFGFSALVSLALLAARRATWSTHLPFGPHLTLATLTTLLLLPH